ncbi:MAG: toll/interleukin-1 receptor domain-containing protein, partial [Kiritimatiellaeota bacterium]|nr:toll/interleukin-1 receptor domain-containing protein [Kiritimatiellota bacterium]
MAGGPAVFICYRREDSADVVGRIYDRLVERFGRDAVFKDVDSIPLGVDFREHLRDSISRFGVILVVIGAKWLSPEGSQR